MTRVLFVCHGNICRSPMAEFVMKKLVREAGCAGQFEIDSCGVSREELSSGLYPPARAKLREKGVAFGEHRARQITRADYESADYILLMDRQNRRWLDRLLGGDPAGKVHLLLEYAGRNDSVADPWYTGDFEAAYQDILEGCRGLLAALTA